MNLPAEKHSHGLRRLAAVETTRGSFDDAVDAVHRTTGQQVGKRQVEGLTSRAAADIEAFYAGHTPPSGAGGDLLVLSCDGKGVVMRPDALRPATAASAAKATPKLAARLSKRRKAQPQADGRGRHRLRRHPSRAHPDRHPAHRRRSA